MLYKKANKTKSVRAYGQRARPAAAPTMVVTIEALLEPRFTPRKAKPATYARS